MAPVRISPPREFFRENRVAAVPAPALLDARPEDLALLDQRIDPLLSRELRFASSTVGITAINGFGSVRWVRQRPGCDEAHC